MRTNEPSGMGQYITGGAGRVIVLDIVGLQAGHVGSRHAPRLSELVVEDCLAELQPPFPAVTIPTQSTLSTGRAPCVHGDVANGEYDRTSDRVALWKREREMRRRLWEAVTEDTALTTGVLFFQRLKGTTADVAVTPAPIEDEHHNLIEMNCWTNPDGFYEHLEAELGHFPLHNYWGPAANEPSSRWILEAAKEAIERHDPDLLWVYVPHLDYDGLRVGPSHGAFEAAISTVDTLVGEFVDWLKERPRWEETAINVLSEYGFHDVERAVFPNRALREGGLLEIADHPDGGTDVHLSGSSAFALVDHQIAHVYTDTPDVAANLLEPLDGLDMVLRGDEKTAYGINHPNAGELVLVANRDAWFQYYWWEERAEAPPYASDTDIHSKPGFDQCELFLGETGMVSLDPTQVGGSHGRVDPEVRGICAFGGPASDGWQLEADIVDAKSVAPTICEILGIRDQLTLTFREPKVLTDR